MCCFFHTLVAALNAFFHEARLPAAQRPPTAPDQEGRVVRRKRGSRSQEVSKKNWEGTGILVEAMTMRGK